MLTGVLVEQQSGFKIDILGFLKADYLPLANDSIL